MQGGRRLGASVFHPRTRLWRTPLFTRCDGLVDACYSSRRLIRFRRVVDFSNPPSRQLAKTDFRRSSSSNSAAACNSVRICALQIFAPLVLACISMDRLATAEDRRSQTAATVTVAADTAALEEKTAFVFGGVNYFHRWSENDQHEFTPTGQENLSVTRLVLFAVPALIVWRIPGFEIREVWYLSVGTVVFQMCVNLFLLRHELGKRLRFDEPENFIPASATAS